MKLKKKILNKLLKTLKNRINQQRIFNHELKKNYKKFREAYKNVYIKSIQS